MKEFKLKVNGVLVENWTWGDSSSPVVWVRKHCSPSDIWEVLDAETGEVVRSSDDSVDW